MKIIYNNIIPFKGFLAINLCGLLFVRHKNKYKIESNKGKIVVNHESIHTEQIKEMAFIFFYLWYLIEWLIRLLFIHPFSKEAYRTISFEKEAYSNEDNLDYLKDRKHYCWIKKIFK